MRVYSTPQQIDDITKILSRYVRLPFIGSSIPGAIMEAVLAHVRNGRVLNTYDFVDVIRSEDHLGWQVKSTKEDTPVTWKRAKIPNADELIERSRHSPNDAQKLGDAIIEFCNSHARHSLETYDLAEIGYCRLILRSDGNVTYFERQLCTREEPQIFQAKEFEWKWSNPKKIVKKEQLQALHGVHRPSGKKWWAWHGLGENQLHFSGEDTWWPEAKSGHAVTFRFPAVEEKISLEKFMDLLSRIDPGN